MKNETGICNDCQHKETCILYKSNPRGKVIACGRFLMNDSLKKTFSVLFKEGEMNDK